MVFWICLDIVELNDIFMYWYDKCLDDNDGKYFIFFFFLIKEKEKKENGIKGNI